MALPHARKRLGRVSILDVLTVLALILAVLLFVRPGSALHASTTRWLATRSMQAAVERDWNELAAVAMPLYDGGGDPEIIEFSDYECPFCRAASPSVDSAVAAGVRVALVHLPLRIHENARPAALATICAGRVGRFREIHHFFMTTTAWRTDTVWSKLPGYMEIAALPEFASCLRDGEATNQLALHLALAERIGIDATPRFFARGKLLAGVPTASNLLTLARPR